MHADQKKLIDFTQTKLGLDNYYLHSHQLYRHINTHNDTVYTLSMEWFPSYINEQEDEDTNPEGTAVVAINVKTGHFKSIIFVGGKSYASSAPFKNLDTNEIAKWIETLTDLEYGLDFELYREDERKLHYQKCIDHIPLSPSSSIQVEYDQEGKLTSFSMSDYFPAKDMIQEESYSVSLAKIEPLAKEQFQSFEVPVSSKKELISVYGMEEIYVTNDGKTTLSFEIIDKGNTYLNIGKILAWQTPIDEPFAREDMKWSEDISFEQAMSEEPHPDSFPLTELDQQKSIVAVETFMRQVYPNDSEKWILKNLHRTNRYIQATLRLIIPNNRVFQRKLTLFIDAKRSQTINYIDNKPFLDAYNQFEDASAEINISKEEAFENIKPLITLKPYYVYDFKQNRYLLCGKLDCNYFVNAATGEVISQRDL